jgi:E3 ubiquitin-protein ligase SHPRH
MELHGSYGSKIQALMRHLLYRLAFHRFQRLFGELCNIHPYLQVAEPEAKSIVFSAWADSLHSEETHRYVHCNLLLTFSFSIPVIEHALRTNGSATPVIDA